MAGLSFQIQTLDEINLERSNGTNQRRHRQQHNMEPSPPVDQNQSTAGDAIIVGLRVASENWQIVYCDSCSEVHNVHVR